MKQEVTLNLLYLEKGNKIMLAMKKRGFGEGRYNGVGGKVEPGETIEQALIRESQEEINVTPINFEKMADINFDEFYKGKPTNMHVHIFIASKWSGEPTESEEMTPKWFNKNNLPFDKMWPNDLLWIPQVFAGKKLIANFKLDKDDQVVSHDIKIIKRF